MLDVLKNRDNTDMDKNEQNIDLENLDKNEQEKKKSMNKTNLKNWLNKSFKIEMTDGRILIGIFLCTDRDGNIILGSCHEYHKSEVSGNIEDPRILGLVMVPGRHIVSIHLDNTNYEIM